MWKDASALLLLFGILLTALGVNASDSLSSEVARLFNGAPIEKAFGYLVGGLVAATLGVTGLLRDDSAGE